MPVHPGRISHACRACASLLYFATLDPGQALLLRGLPQHRRLHVFFLRSKMNGEMVSVNNNIGKVLVCEIHPMVNDTMTPVLQVRRFIGARTIVVAFPVYEFLVILGVVFPCVACAGSAATSAPVGMLRVICVPGITLTMPCNIILQNGLHKHHSTLHTRKPQNAPDMNNQCNPYTHNYDNLAGDAFAFRIGFACRFRICFGVFT